MTHLYELHLRFSLLYGCKIPKLKDDILKTQIQKSKKYPNHFNSGIFKRIDLQRSITQDFQLLAASINNSMDFRSNGSWNARKNWLIPRSTYSRILVHTSAGFPTRPFFNI
jgi:hypothetical protein